MRDAMRCTGWGLNRRGGILRREKEGVESGEIAHVFD
jgi:hypothetical protein